MAKMEKECRARGGKMPAGFKAHDEAEKKASEKKHHRRKHGGEVKGEKGAHRPDRRARGGATSDANPLSSAGRMSKPDYEVGHEPAKDTHGRGSDRD